MSSVRRLSLTCSLVAFAGCGDTSLVVSQATPVALELRIAETEPSETLIEAEDPKTGDKVYLHPAPILSNRDVEKTSLGRDRYGHPAVNVSVEKGSQPAFHKETTAHVGGLLVILLDGKVQAVHKLREPLSDSFQISGAFTEAESREIADGILAR